MEQSNTNRYQFAGFEAHFLERNKKGNLWEVQLGNAFRLDELNSEFVLKIQEESLERPNDFQNDLRYITNDFFLKSKYLWNFKALKISGIIELHQFYNEFANQEKEITEHPIFVNPKLEFDWKPNRRNRIFIASSYTTSNSGILNLVNNYYLNGFRSFSRGTNDFNQVGSWRHQLNYELGNLGNRFFATAGVSYQKRE